MIIDILIKYISLGLTYIEYALFIDIITQKDLTGTILATELFAHAYPKNARQKMGYLCLDQI